jgi:hypothetical protein
MWRKSILFAAFLASSACQKPAPPKAQPEQNAERTPLSIPQISVTPAQLTPTPEPRIELATGSNPVFAKVSANLDPGGLVYLFWSADKLFAEMDKKLASVRDEAINAEGLSADEKESLKNELDLTARIVSTSGLEGIKAIGFSSKKEDSGLFLNKSFIYLPDRSGFLWETFAKPSHDLKVLDSIPANTEAFAFYDVDLGALWRSVSNVLAESKVPAATDWVQKFPQRVQGLLGMNPDDLAASLGDQIGFIVTLDPKSSIQIPGRGQDAAVEIPEPAAALIWTVKDDKIFDRLDTWFSLNPQVQKIDEPDLKMRLLPGRAPAQYVSMALARSGDYLIIATSDKLVRAIVNTRAGKIPGVKSSPEFGQLSAGLPEQGNGVAYATKTFQNAATKIRAVVQPDNTAGNGSLSLVQKIISQLSADASRYSVTITGDEGIRVVGQSTKDLNESLGDFAALPTYFMAEKLVDEIRKNRGSDKVEQIRINLKKIESAKQRAVTENEIDEGQMVSRQDIEPFLTEWPSPVVGETYEVGTAGQPPYATAPVDLNGYPAGTHIEP